jgi:hypothetical protein
MTLAEGDAGVDGDLIVPQPEARRASTRSNIQATVSVTTSA